MKENKRKALQSKDFLKAVKRKMEANKL